MGSDLTGMASATQTRTAAGQAPRQEALKPSSIVVIQFRFMGDLVMGTALLDNLRRHYPDARLSIVSDANNAAFLKLRPDVDFIPYPRRKKGSGRRLAAGIAEWIGVVRALRARHADVLVDCSNSRSGAVLSALSDVPIRIGFRPYKWIPKKSYTEFASDWGNGTHTIDRMLSPLDSLGLSVVVREPQLQASAQTAARIERLLEDSGLRTNEFVTIHLGARVAGRQWPLEDFARVVDEISERYGLRAAIIGGPDERESAAALCKLSGTSPVDLVGKFTPEELSAVLARCRFFLGNDSGPMHVAAASGAKVVALFGLQSPERWGPLGEGHVIVRPSMPCPCPTPDLCRPPDPQATYCVRRLSVGDVLNGVAVMMRE